VAILIKYKKTCYYSPTLFKEAAVSRIVRIVTFRYYDRQSLRLNTCDK